MPQRKRISAAKRVMCGNNSDKEENSAHLVFGGASKPIEVVASSIRLLEQLEQHTVQPRSDEFRHIGCKIRIQLFA